jgi:hypothetical protein
MAAQFSPVSATMSDPTMPRAAAAKFKSALANAGLVGASVLVTYLIGELLFFRLLLPHLSLNIKPYLPDRADVVTQNSKAGYVPKDYIALLGDSYAEGLGDWLLAANGNRALPFHSANVLHENLGRDVVSLGKGGSGSAEAFVRKVARVFDDDDCYLFPKLQPPRRFLAYFFEGNDLEDNYRFLARNVGLNTPDIVPNLDAVLRWRPPIVPYLRCHAHFATMAYQMAIFVANHYSAEARLFARPTPNQVLIGGVRVPAYALPVPPANAEIVDYGILVFDRSLRWLRQRFPDVPVTVVYLPAPASVYRFPGADVIGMEWILPYDEKRRGPWRRPVPVPVEAVNAASQRVCEKIAAASAQHGSAFVDTRPTIRAETAKRALHGPRDWGHFNEAGYRLLGTVLTARLDDRPGGQCDDAWDRPPHAPAQ